MGVLKRSILICTLFQIILWITFGIAYYFNLDAWNSVTGISQTISTGDSLIKTFILLL